MFIEKLTNDKNQLCAAILVCLSTILCIISLLYGEGTLRALCGVISCVLFVVYQIIIKDRKKSVIIYSAILVFLMLEKLTFFLHRHYVMLDDIAVLQIMVAVVYAFLFVIAIISLYKGGGNKSITVLMIFGILWYAVPLLWEIRYLIHTEIYNSKIFYNIGMILFSIAMLFFSKVYGLHNVFLLEKNIQMIHSESPYRALEMLKAEFDAGTITEKRYQRERAKIISKL